MAFKLVLFPYYDFERGWVFIMLSPKDQGDCPRRGWQQLIKLLEHKHFFILLPGKALTAGTQVLFAGAYM